MMARVGPSSFIPTKRKNPTEGSEGIRQEGLLVCLNKPAENWPRLHLHPSDEGVPRPFTSKDRGGLGGAVGVEC